MTKRLRVIILACLLNDFAIGAVRGRLSVSDHEGLPVLRVGGIEALSTTYAFWGPNWQWAEQVGSVESTKGSSYKLNGRVPALALTMVGTVASTNPGQFTWRWKLDAERGRREVIGGGLVFHFDLETFGALLGQPELLPGRNGWTWGKQGGLRIELLFDAPLAALYFERGNSNEIRAYFYNETIAAGVLHVAAVASVSKDISWEPAQVERFGNNDTSRWPLSGISTNSSPIDLSFLNSTERPAGRRGFLRAVGSRLQFEDGTPVRFWGTNLNAAALFSSSPQQVRLHARRLSRLGYNLVRFHHHDSQWVNPNIFGNESRPDTKSLHPNSMDQLDWWIKCLRDEGIYVWLDLHVGRALKQEDGIEAYDEIRKTEGRVDLRGYNYVNPSIQAAMNRFNFAYLDRINAHTGLRYRDDPAIVAVMLSNENDLTQHFGNLLLPDKNVPRHNAWYTAAAERFAKDHQLPRDRVWRSWEHGPSKLFLSDLEYKVQRAQLNLLRDRGLRVPAVSTSTWGGNPVSALPALHAAEIIDVHAYAAPNELERDPRHAATSVHWMAMAQIANKPLSVSEWNMEPFPTVQRQSLPIYVAASGSHQGWAAMLHFAYSQQGLDGGSGYSGNYESFNDPVLTVTLPVAALMYRRGDVAEARTTYVYAPTAEALFNTRVDANNSPGLRIAAERGKLVVALPEVRQLPWLIPTPIPVGARHINPMDVSHLALRADEVISDHGEIRRNWGHGYIVVDTPRTQVVTGWLSDKVLRTQDMQVKVSTRYATVAVQSLTMTSIRDSRDILISLMTRVKPGIIDGDKFWIEPLVGSINLRAPSGLRLYAVEGANGRSRPLPTKYHDGAYMIDLGSTDANHWLRLH